MISFDPEDQGAVDQLRRDLTGWRKFTGQTQKQIAAASGLCERNISEIERGFISVLRFPLLCAHAQVFRLVINAQFEDIEIAGTDEIKTLDAMAQARPYAGVWMDQLLVAILVAARDDLGIPAELMAKKLEMPVDVFTRWEQSPKPNLAQLMMYARQLGGRLHVRLDRFSSQ